jgi:23S rRNA (uridine2552-2'-O)-methyltransferase
VLHPSGNFFVKVFEGDMLADFVKTVGKHFVTVKVIKPKASRAKSSEMFLLAMNLKSA